jgi:Ser/Thr protein kinase RdoA (MazF antagonist)
MGQMDSQIDLIESVMLDYGFDPTSMAVSLISNGLINRTWKVEIDQKQFILQQINTEVFLNPTDIADNIHALSTYLQKAVPDYFFVAPIASKSGLEMIRKNGSGYFRIFPFVKYSHTKKVVEQPSQAYEAALQFGLFTESLQGFDVHKLKYTIPGFHDLSKRYIDFLEAIEAGNPARIRHAHGLVAKLKSYASIVDQYKAIQVDPAFKLRVTHHDTKISNVLFNDDDKGICVIDLDTVMPGYMISDLGDMMRTYLCAVSEEEQDFSKIQIRDDFYRAIVQGYQDGMKEGLSLPEKNAFFYAGKFMMYMQALRFLTDYLQNDRYYGARYPAHNYIRAGNQTTLLERFIEKEHLLG